MTYHLDGLGNLLLKTADGKYMLSPLGRTAVSMMKQVEEPPSKTPPHVSLSVKKWKLLVVALTLGIILLSAAFFFEYQNMSLPNYQSSSLEDRYVVNGSVESALAKNETSKFDPMSNVSSSFALLYGAGHVRLYSLGSLADNSTLEIEMQILDSIGHGAGISIAVYAVTVHPVVAYTGTLDKDLEPVDLNSTRQVVEWAHSYDRIWSSTADNGSRFSVLLPEAGDYYIVVEGPVEWNGTDYHTIGYTMTLQIQYQGNYVPFSFGNEQDSSVWAFFPT